MPGPTATAGVVGLPCSSATNHRDSGAEHQVVVPTFKAPLKSPLVQGGTLFSSNVAPPRREKLPCEAHKREIQRGWGQRPQRSPEPDIAFIGRDVLDNKRLPGNQRASFGP